MNFALCWKFMIISIGGDMGSGKSSLGERLAQELAWPRYYIGGMRRQKAKERGMTLAEYNKLGEIDPNTDEEVDKYQRELGEKEDNFVIEGRTSWYFIPHSLKIYLQASDKIAAQRIFNQLQSKNERNEDKKFKNVNDALESIQKRKKSDNKRYRKYYGIDVYDPSNYDFVINTDESDKEKVFQIAYKYIKDKLNK